jgi:predicted  nucleic acid-binding Zn-ribbon protein
MNRAKQLYELQEIDLTIEQKTENLERVRGQLGKDDDLVSARTALDAARKLLADLEHQQRTAEWETEELGTKIAAEEKKLYAGSVKNPRELMSLQHETDVLKQKHKEQEEQLLAVMMEVDSAQQEANLRKGELEAAERDWKENQDALSGQQTELEAELAELAQKREALNGEADSASLKIYGDLRRQKQGLAVAKVMQGRCQGCRMSLPVSDQQKARTGQELAKCSNCGRILYMD